MRAIIPGSTPLTASIEGDDLVIRIGVETLAFAFERSDDNYSFNDQLNDYKQNYKVTDCSLFAKAVALSLFSNEDEDGSTALTRAFDSACIEAIEGACEGVEETA